MSSYEACALPDPGTSRARRWTAVGTVCIGWLSVTTGPLWRHFSHLHTISVLLSGVVLCSYAMYRMGKGNYEGKRLSVAWIVAVFLFLVLACALLYSRRSHLGGGSDREDALHTALTAVEHHVYPYSLRTYLGNPITPLPGALLLAGPFFLLGHISLQNILWIALLFILCEKYFRYRSSSFLLLSIFLVFMPPNISDITAGGDYVVNLIYVIVALACCLRALQESTFVQACAFAFLGVAISSRVLYFLTVIPLFIALVQRVSWRRASALYALALGAFLLVTVPVFSPHPAKRFLLQLEQQSGKLRSLPVALHAEFSLPLLAALIMCFAIFFRLDFAKLLLFVGIANTVVLVPPIAALTIAGRWPVHELDYLVVCILPLYFWVFHCYELLTTPPTNSAASAIA